MQDLEFNKSEEARKLFFSNYDGILSTISVHFDGYPFGSVTPFCLDREGRPVILISTLAQHTRNIKKNSKVCLTITDKVIRSSDVQAQGRLTYIGDVEIIPEDEIDEVSQRYIRYLPAAKQYFKMHDFSFYRLNNIGGRFIGGFGKIFWLDPSELLLNNPFSEESESEIINHMNNDHQNALKRYLRVQHDLNLTEVERIEMIGIDVLGLDIRFEEEVYRIWFDKQVSDPQTIRDVLTYLNKN